MAIRDFKSRYLNSVLGGMWAVLNPLAIIIVYTAIFSQVMQAKLPGINQTWAYSIYLCAGLLPWNYFVETAQRMQTIFLDQSVILKKMNFPKITLPFYVLLSSSINFVIVFTIYLLFLVLNNQFPGWVIINVIPLLVIQQVIALALGILAGTLNVFFRDVGHVFGIILQFWFWFTPVVYTLDILPEKFKGMISWNFMVPVVNGYHDIFLYHSIPSWGKLISPAVFALVLLIIGYFVFKKLSKEMVDEL